ncbi:MAG TPA: M28 family peptidase [Terriglobia bacterium]|nr:M28 family peptidase [Terriglobia bacterium]
MTRKWDKLLLAVAVLLLPAAFAADLQAQAGHSGLSGQSVPAFSGQRAYEDIRHLVAFGPRPPGSPALAESRQWIIRELQADGCAVEQDTFTAPTPMGNIDMDNIIVKIPGERQSVVMLAGHYDTKLFKDFRFVGANDGGSSAAFLMEMGRDLCRGHKYKFTTWLVFFDGEEAIQQEMSSTDGTYGSRHLEQKLAADGELDRIQAMILVDMIGDKNLDIRRDDNSTGWLNNLLFKTADRLDYSRYFLKGESLAVGDDHTPFIEAGVSAVDIIDFDYGPNNSYWHSAGDTLDHCSPASLEIVGRVVSAILGELDRSPRIK